MFQMTRKELADVEIRGTIHTYQVDGDQLESARRKMHDGIGSIEWARRYSSDDDEKDIINVRSIDRIRPWSEWDRRTALVQLAYRTSTGECFLVDPDQFDTVFPRTPTGTETAGDGRTFAEETRALVDGEFLTLADLESVPRPPADGDMVLIAEWTHRGGAQLLDGIDARELSVATRLYLGDLAPIPQRRPGVDDAPGDPRPGCVGDPCTLDHMHFFKTHGPEGVTA